MHAPGVATDAAATGRAWLLALALTLPAGAALAQAQKSGPFQGFGGDNGKPINVNSESLEVRQNEKMAIFSGKVVAKQGESTLRAPKLTVFYEEGAQGGQAAPTQGGSIKRLEATGGVVVTSQDQKATGSRGVFDMKANTATLTGNVVLVQGPNVIRGSRLVINLKTGIARVVSGGGPNDGVWGLFVPNSQKKPNAN